jgi:hypothetical protein
MKAHGEVKHYYQREGWFWFRARINIFGDGNIPVGVVILTLNPVSYYLIKWLSGGEKALKKMVDDSASRVEVKFGTAF